MKFKSLIGSGLLALLAVSCTLKEPAAPVEQQVPEVRAGFEAAPGTRASVGQDGRVVWDEADAISVFYRTTGNMRYVLKEGAGTPEGVFATTGSFQPGAMIPYICGFYPYSRSMKLTPDGCFSFDWPAEQTYVKDGFGPESNLMVAVSEDNNLFFMNIGGYLVLPLYGDKVAVESITLMGNAGEPLAGPVEVYANPGSAPSAELGDDAVDAVVLKTKKPVMVGETEDDATEFWFVLPPMEFEEGFTLLITCNGEELEFVADAPDEPYEILRSQKLVMDALCIKAASIDVTGVAVEPVKLGMTVGDEEQLNAVIEPADATNQNVSWASSDEDVVTVDEEGVVTAVGEGQAVITVTTEDGGFEAECNVYVAPKGVTGITVTPATMEIPVGTEQTLSWTIEPADAANQEVSFVIEGEDNVVTISDDGIVEAVGVGSVTITVVTVDGGYTGSCEVTTYMPGVEIPFEETFEADLGEFEAEDVDNDYDFDVWTFNERYGAYGTAYVDLDGDDKKECYQVESHLVSPYLDLREEDLAILSFRYAINFGDESNYASQFWIEVFDGAVATTIPIPNLPAKGSWTFRDCAVDLTPFCGKTVRIEFVYSSEGLTESVPTIEIDNIKVAAEKVTATISAPVTITTTVGKTLQLNASTNSDAALSFESLSPDVVSVSGTGEIGALAEGTANIKISVPETACFTAKTVYCQVTVEPVPAVDYSTIHTSNVTLSSNTSGSVSASTCKVKYGNDTFDGLKGGTGSVAGAIAFTIPAGTKKIHLHAFGWKNESVTLTLSGATSDPASISIVSNNGISSNSPFTVNTVDGSYFAFNLSNVTSDATIVLKATTGKRFVVWGINAE